MSTRYVWDVYDVNKIASETERATTAEDITYYNNQEYVPDDGSEENLRKIMLMGVGAKKYTLTNDGFKVDNYTWVETFSLLSASANRYISPYSTNRYEVMVSPKDTFDKLYAAPEFSSSDNYVWWLVPINVINGSVIETHAKVIVVHQNHTDEVNKNNYQEYGVSYKVKGISYTTSKGDNVIRTVSGPINSHPDNAIGWEDDGKTQIWYVLKGSDTIDPASVSYDSTKIEAGEPITVNVTPSANVYGGTISYLYQYSVDGGRNWTNAGDATTSTQKEIIVPQDAGGKLFTVRVQASDDMGFTSTDYVYSGPVEVESIHIWVGVDNAARPGAKLWVGVNNVARRAVKAWVGDENGNARRWF